MQDFIDNAIEGLRQVLMSAECNFLRLIKMKVIQRI